MKTTHKLWRGLASTGAVLLALSAFMTSLLYKWEGQVNVALGTTGSASGITNGLYAIDYDTREEYLKASDEHDARTEREGAVLVKNDDNALPFADSERRVTLFGRASADPVYRGNSGGPMIDSARLVSLRAALEKEGFQINDTLYQAYLNSGVSRVKVAVENKDGLESDIGEVDPSFYTSSLKASYENDYNQAAIVVFSRDGGEGRDLLPEDADGVRQLSLHKNEADLLKMIKNSGKFKKVVVLLNSAYPMELGWVEQDEYGVDACLWIGGTGLNGFTGVAELLVGKADPSGHFVDTYASNSLSSPAAQNAFNYTSFTNGGNYIVEAEGIYVGYKYYETRYYDGVLNRFNADGRAGAFASENGWNYAEEIAYPFGYGTSYASFTQTLTSLEWDRTAHTVTANVHVVNNGGVYSGKSRSVVELYVSLPYEKGQAEKSAIQLIDFGKTKELAAGESEDIEITVSDYIFATYDESATNGADSSKKGCYVFDKGDYYFAIGDDCHDALNNVLAAQNQTDMTDHQGNPVSGDKDKATVITLSETDNTTYAKSQYTGIPGPFGGYGMEWEPVVDGDYIPSNPVTENGFAENGKDIPLLIGSNLMEWTRYMSSEQLTVTDEVLNAFTSAYPNEPAENAKFADTLIRLPMLKIMSHKADQKGAKVYSYLFTYGISTHGAEIPYTFANGRGKMNEIMPSVWANFAKTGTPAADGLPRMGRIYP